MLWKVRRLLPAGCPAPEQLSVGRSAFLPLLPCFLAFPKTCSKISPQTSDFTSPSSFFVTLLYLQCPFFFDRHFPKVLQFIQRPLSEPRPLSLTVFLPTSYIPSPYIAPSYCRPLISVFPPFVALPFHLITSVCVQQQQHFAQVIQSIQRPLISPGCPFTSVLHHSQNYPPIPPLTSQQSNCQETNFY